MRVEERLRRAAPPDMLGAHDRAQRVVLAAAPAIPQRRRRTPLFVLAALVLTGLALTPPGEAVARWLRDLVDPNPPRHVVGGVGRLPAGGRILADGPFGAYVTTADGRWRRLSSLYRPVWSPHGRFVAVHNENTLRVIEPDGDERWELDASGPISAQRWSTTGYRIAYRRDDDLRVVAGDGSGDHPLVDSVAEVAPAWRPGPANEVAVARLNGRIELWAADAGDRLWSRRAGDVRYLAWTPSGRLVAVTTDELLVLAGDGGQVLMRRSLNPKVEQAALAPDGSQVALRRAKSVALIGLRPEAQERARLELGSGSLTTMLWAPNGEALLAVSGERWYFLPPHGGPVRATTVGTPRGGVAPTDWCCAEG